jgi:hypothetical protein
MLVGIGLLLTGNNEQQAAILPNTEVVAMPPRQTRERAVTTLMLTNTGSAAYRVVGADVGGCNFQGCVQVVDQLPVTIPAHSSHAIHLAWVAGKPGELKRTIVLYTDCPGNFEIPIHITGHALDRN